MTEPYKSEKNDRLVEHADNRDVDALAHHTADSDPNVSGRKGSSAGLNIVQNPLKVSGILSR